MRIVLVSAFLPEVTQQIHSLRESGVISSHTASAFGEESRAFCKSAGTLCIVYKYYFISLKITRLVSLKLGLKILIFLDFAIIWQWKIWVKIGLKLHL